MKFFLADTFKESLGSLPADMQKAAKTTVYDIQANPSHPSLQIHKLNKAIDSGFRSARVSQDYRVILHQML